MEFFSMQMKYKADKQNLYSPCVLQIKDGFIAFQKRSVAGTAIGGYAGHLLSKAAREKNEVIVIPISEITSVETKSSFATALVIVASQNRPTYTFACTSKNEMNQIAGWLRK